MNNQKRIYYFDGLKGIICWIVFLGHFYIAFVYKDIFSIDSFENKIIVFIVSGCWTVPLFCIVSGFLCGQKKINSFYELLLNCFNRFLRFQIPLFFIYLAILYLNKQNLFIYADLIGGKLTNKRLINLYDFKTHYSLLLVVCNS